jgi:hypothetical protein
VTDLRGSAAVAVARLTRSRVHDRTDALLDLRSPDQLDDPARALGSRQGRRAASPAAGGRGAAAAEPETEAGLGRPSSLDATLNQLADQAGAGTNDTSARTEAAQARIADLDKKIAQYRASLDAGRDPAVIGPWIAETQAQKVAARAEIRSATGQRRMTRDEIAAIVTALGDLVQVIRNADPADKAHLYAQLVLQP